MKIRNQPDTPLQINDATNEQIPRLKWLTLNGNIVENIEDDIRNNIELWSNLIGKDRLKFIVSCDSQRHGNKVIYVTAIIFLRCGHGGNAYYLKENTEIPNFLNKFESKDIRIKQIQSYARNRIWNECLKAIACAKWLDQILLDFHLKVKEIHSDINISKKYLSNELLSAINGYILSQEYIPVIKPDAWGASKIADSKTK